MGEFDDLLGDVIAEVPAAPQSEYLSVPPEHPAMLFEQFTDNERMARFIVETMSVPFNGINDTIIHQGYAAVLWKFRESALLGDIDRTRSLKMWLDWAQPHINRPAPEEAGERNPGTAAFMPREAK